MAGAGWEMRADSPPAKRQVGVGVEAGVLSVRPGGGPRPHALLAGLPVGRQPHRLCQAPAGWAGTLGGQRAGPGEGLRHRAGQGGVACAGAPGPGGVQQGLPPGQLLRPEQGQVLGLRGLREEREEGAPRPVGSRERTVVAALGRQGALRERAPFRGREVPPAAPGPRRPPCLPGRRARHLGNVGQGRPWRRGAARGLRCPAPWRGAASSWWPPAVGARVGGRAGVGPRRARAGGRRRGAAAAPVLNGARGAVQGAAHPCCGHHVTRGLQHLEHAGLGRAGGEVRAGWPRGAGQALHPAEAAVDALGGREDTRCERGASSSPDKPTSLSEAPVSPKKQLTFIRHHLLTRRMLLWEFTEELSEAPRGYLLLKSHSL